MTNISTNRKLSPVRLQRTKELLDGYIRSGKLPGYACLLSQDQTEVAYFSAGYRDSERGKTIDRDTLYRIYSMTKPITSVAMMQLFEQGRFLLEDPVAKYIPSWQNLKVFDKGTADKYTVVEPKRPMTIKDLLMHTSGLTYGFDQKHPVEELYQRNKLDQLRDGDDLEKKIELLSQIPLQFSPGDYWQYSVATDVLGYLIQVITGQPIDKYFQSHIFDPLGMNDTIFKVSADKLDRFSACYIKSDDSNSRVAYTLQDDPENSGYAKEPLFLSGGGGLVSTIDDYQTFTNMLLGKGVLQHESENRILGTKTVEFMSKNHLPGNIDMFSMKHEGFSESNERGVGFGLGFSVVVDDTRSNVMKPQGAFGWGGMASTLFWVDPAENITMTFMTQLIPSDTYSIRAELSNTIYQALC